VNTFNPTWAMISAISPSPKPAARTCAEVLFGHSTSTIDHRAGELERCRGSGVGCTSVATRDDIVAREPGSATERRVGGEAVVAGVRLGDG
jgi:hypothetical protein